MSDHSQTAPVDTAPLANQIASMQEEQAPLGLRQGMVDSVQQGSVSVKVGASTTATTGLRYLGDTPVVGDSVWLLENGPDKLILGAIGRPAVPAGTIIMFGSANPPSGWLLCDGRSTGGFPNLAAAVGPNVPDLRNRFVVAAGGNYSHGATGGAAEVALSVAQLANHNHEGFHHSHLGPSHSHGQPAHSHEQYVTAAVGGPGVRSDYDSDAASGAFPQGIRTGADGDQRTHADGNQATTHDGNAYVTGPRGDGQPHENRPPYFALTFIIRT